MAWDNIATSDVYRTAPAEKQQAMRSDYFHTFLAPKIPQPNREAAAMDWEDRNAPAVQPLDPTKTPDSFGNVVPFESASPESTGVPQVSPIPKPSLWPQIQANVAKGNVSGRADWLPKPEDISMITQPIMDQPPTPPMIGGLEAVPNVIQGAGKMLAGTPQFARDVADNPVGVVQGMIQGVPEGMSTISKAMQGAAHIASLQGKPEDVKALHDLYATPIETLMQAFGPALILMGAKHEAGRVGNLGDAVRTPLSDTYTEMTRSALEKLKKGEQVTPVEKAVVDEAIKTASETPQPVSDVVQGAPSAGEAGFAGAAAKLKGKAGEGAVTVPVAEAPKRASPSEQRGAVPEAWNMTFDKFNKTPIGTQLKSDGARSHENSRLAGLTGTPEFHAIKKSNPDYLNADQKGMAASREASSYWLNEIAKAAESGKEIPEDVKSYVSQKFFMLDHPSDRPYMADRLAKAGVISLEDPRISRVIKESEASIRRNQLTEKLVGNPNLRKSLKASEGKANVSKSVKSEPQPAVKGEAKEAWQMTREEFGKDIKRVNEQDDVSEGRFGRMSDNEIGGMHKSAVESALRSGKSVPAEVLADYPDLQPKPEAAPSPASVPTETRGAVQGQPRETAPSSTLPKGRESSSVGVNSEPLPKPAEAKVAKNISRGEGYGSNYQVGEIISKKDGSYQIVTEVGKPRYVNNDGMSFGVGKERGNIYQAKAREATPTEIADHRSSELMSEAKRLRDVAKRQLTFSDEGVYSKEDMQRSHDKTILQAEELERQANSSPSLSSAKATVKQAGKDLIKGEGGYVSLEDNPELHDALKVLAKEYVGRPLQDLIDTVKRIAPDLKLDPKALADIHAMATGNDNQKGEAPKAETIGMSKAEIKAGWDKIGNELPKVDREHWQVAVDKAQEAGTIENAHEIALDVLNEPRSLDRVERAGIAVRRAMMENDIAVKREEAAKLREQGKIGDAKFIDDQTDLKQTIVNNLEEALVRGGTETGRDLAFIRAALKRDDYSVAKMTRVFKERTGKEPNPVQTQEINRLNKLIADQDAKVKELENKYAEQDARAKEISAKLEFRRKQLESRTMNRQRKVSDIHADRTRLEKELLGMGFRLNDITTVTAEGITKLSQLALTYAEEGGITFADAADKVISRLKNAQLTREVLLDAMDRETSKAKSKYVKAAKEEVVRLKKERVKPDRTQKQIERVNLKIADLEERIRTRNFEPLTVKLRKPVPRELEEARIRLAITKHKWSEYVAKSQPLTAGRVIGGIWNAPRNILLSLDVGHMFRQAWWFTTGKYHAGMFIDSLKAYRSRDGAERIWQNLQAEDGHYFCRKYKIDFTEPNEVLTHGEEMFRNNLLERIPIARGMLDASNRSMAVGMNVIRQRAFLNYMAAHPFATDVELSAHANLINFMTGRGSWGKYTPVGNILGNVMTAPKMSVSRFVTPELMARYFIKYPAMRKTIARYVVGSIGATMGILGLAQLSGFKVITDNPRDPDWLKIVLPNGTRIDPWGGNLQGARLILRIVLKGSDAYDVKVPGIPTATNKEKNTTLNDLLMQFATYREVPSIAMVEAFYTKRDVMGRKVEPTEAIINSLMPLILQDIRDAKKSGIGFMGVAAAGVASGVGVGIQTYPSTSSSSGIRPIQPIQAVKPIKPIKKLNEG